MGFAFAANGAREWGVESTIVVRDGDFPDDDATSDHRAVRVVVR